MRTAIGTILTNKTASSLSDVKQIGSALSQATLVKEEVTVGVQVRTYTVLVLKRLKWSYPKRIHARYSVQEPRWKHELRGGSRKKRKEPGQDPAFLGVQTLMITNIRYYNSRSLAEKIVSSFSPVMVLAELAKRTMIKSLHSFPYSFSIMLTKFSFGAYFYEWFSLCRPCKSNTEE